MYSGIWSGWSGRGGSVMAFTSSAFHSVLFVVVRFKRLDS